MKKPIYAITLLALLGSAIPVQAGVMDGLRDMLPFTQGSPVELPMNTVVIPDRKLAKRVKVESLVARQTYTETTEVIVRFFNKTKKPVQLAVRSSFFDTDRVLVEDPSVWRQVHIQPRSFASYSISSMTRYEQLSFLVEVQGQLNRY